MLLKTITENWTIEKWDVEGAYLTAPIEEKLVIIDDRVTGSKAWILNKSIYGTKQAGRNFEEYRNTAAAYAGLKPASYDRGVLLSRDSIMTTHVDDILIAAPSVETLNTIRRKMGEMFVITPSGRPTQWLGMELEWGHAEIDNSVTLKQSQMIKSLAKRIGILTSATTPMVIGADLGLGETLDNQRKKNYQAVLGTLMYIACGTRPDIAFAVSAAGQWMANPTTAAEKAITRIVQYLMGTATYGIRISRATDSVIRIYSDASFPGPKDDRKGQSGYVVTLGNKIIAWISTKQKHVALSTAEAELSAATFAAQEGVWLKNLTIETWGNLRSSAEIYVDSIAAKQAATRRGLTERTKHLDVKEMWLKEKVEQGVLEIFHIAGSENPANVLTKPTPQGEIEKFREWATGKEINA